MKFEVLILGTNAALPHNNKITSAQVLNADEYLYLLDCGEGTQMKLEKFKVRKNKIKAIFISHLHGDHFFGLPGLLTSFGHHHRKDPLHIFGPVGITRYVQVVLDTCQAFLGYDVRIVETDTATSQIIYTDQKIQVSTIPLKHRIPTNGYLIRQVERPYNLDGEKIKKYNLSIEQIRQIKDGKDIYLSEGNRLRWQDMTLTPVKQKAYAYCTDTVYDETIVALINGVDLLYHETTYLDDMSKEAQERMHSTISDAAKIAVLAGAGKLLTGHYSGRYLTTDDFLHAGKKLFEPTLLSYEGLVIPI
jgi:ribonuclease Z